MWDCKTIKQYETLGITQAETSGFEVFPILRNIRLPQTHICCHEKWIVNSKEHLIHVGVMLGHVKITRREPYTHSLRYPPVTRHGNGQFPILVPWFSRRTKPSFWSGIWGRSIFEYRRVGNFIPSCVNLEGGRSYRPSSFWRAHDFYQFDRIWWYELM